jgi:hypothetical protein
VFLRFNVNKISGGIKGINPDPSRFSFHIGNVREKRGFFFFSDIIEAASNCVEAGANVISIALSCKDDPTPGQRCLNADLQRRLEEIYDLGVLIIGGAGNTNSSSDEYPGMYKTVMSVSAVDANNMWYKESTRNAQVEISAPGE